MWRRDDPVDGELRGLRATTDRQREELARQRAEIDAIHADVHMLLGRIREHFPGTGVFPAGGWRNLSPDTSRELWLALGEWVQWLRERYPLREKLPSCWWRHPAAVEVLSALFDSWHGVYVDRRGAVADWQRALTDTLSDLTDWLPDGCRRGQHHDDGADYGGPWVDDPAAFRDHFPSSGE